MRQTFCRSFVVAAVIHLALAPLSVAAGKHRAVRPRCDLPTLTITVTPATVCRNETVTVSWLASDRTAVVTIDAIGSNLPYGGLRQMTITNARTFTGSATSACGVSSPATSAVALRPDPAGTISAPDSIQQGSSAQLILTTSNTTSWTLTSILGNPLFPSVGSGSGSFATIYSASTSGTDTLQLSIFGICGGTALNTARSIRVNATTPAPLPVPQPAPVPQPPPAPTPVPTPTPTPVPQPPPPTPTPTPVPQPPPPSGTLRCCDGTLSPTCTSCANKKGCCSSHGGVCGCG